MSRKAPEDSQRPCPAPPATRPWAMNPVQSRGGLVFKAHGLVYHAALGSRAIKEKKLRTGGAQVEACWADSMAGLGIRGGV